MTTQDQVNQILITLGATPEGVYSNVRVRLDILEARINNPNLPAPNVTNPFYIDGYGGTSISVGDGYPVDDRTNGSMYLRRDGTVSEGLYLRRNGNWELSTGGGGSLYQSILYKDTIPVITAQASPSPFGGNSAIFDGYLLFDADFSPQIFGVAPTSTHDGYILTILGQNDYTNTYIGGDILVQSGDGYSAGNIIIKAGDNNQGNLIINGDNNTNMQNAEGAIFIKNGDVVPTGNPTDGGYLFVENGALKFRGSSGTVTIIAPA